MAFMEKQHCYTYIATDSLKEVKDINAISPSFVIEYTTLQTLIKLPLYQLTLKKDIVCQLYNLSVD